MKKLTIAALLAGQALATAQPASGAGFARIEQQRAGAFGGFSLRVPFGNARRAPIRAGLTIAPLLQRRDGDGATLTRIGEGLEFGYRSGRPLSLSIAGSDLGRQRLAAQGDGGGDGVPRWALAVAAVAVTLGLAYWGVSEAMDCDPEEECS